MINEGKSYFKAEKIRHPLIEQINQNELYVSNDIELGDDFNCILLYGTNAVGKSSLIKSIGINIILAQSGNYVPCSSFIYFPYTALFTSIFNTDNIFKGFNICFRNVSELRNILKYADKNSIVLGDELCSGTESSSSHSIFSTALEMLNERGVSNIWASHMKEILDFDEIKNLKNLKIFHLSVIYDKEKHLIYDRKLKEGCGDILYGLEVCKALDLDEEFIESFIKLE